MWELCSFWIFTPSFFPPPGLFSRGPTYFHEDNMKVERMVADCQVLLNYILLHNGILAPTG
jgi:hypothetical protein